jgi:CBS domain containing-hemolysin-like protein
MVPLILIMGEMIPKSIFQQYADSIAPKIACFILVSSWIFYPIIVVLSKISRGTVHMFADKNGPLYPSYITKAGLESILKDDGAQSDILKSEKEMIRKIFNFPEYRADHIMVPISNVFALPADATLQEAAAAITEKGYSRIPVYQDRIFNIIGVLHTFDLLEALCKMDSGEVISDSSTSIEKYVKKNILYVPETIPAGELLIELQKRGEQLAVMIDEYGDATGIGTIEDILEEIVGEIDDEDHSEGKNFYRRIGQGKYIFDGRTSIDYIKHLNVFDIPDGDYETLGGFLLYKLGRVPGRNEIVRQDNILFVIEESDIKSIKKVLIVLPSEKEIPKKNEQK